MESSDFVHLHVHTQYSLLDGACRIQNLLKRAVEYKMPALAMTDHGNILTSRWGADSAQQLGVVMSRVERFEASLSPTDFDNWLDFFHNRISAQERAAILGEIAT